MRKDCMAREMTLEVIVGAFIAVAMLGLGVFTIILSGEKLRGEKFPMVVVFNDVMGLSAGDKVVARGMPIGKVKSLDLQPDGPGVSVQLTLDKALSMKRDYRITIVSTSILGGRHLNISEGSQDLAELPEGIVFRGEDAYDLMADAAEVVNAVKDGLIEGGVIENFKEMSAQMREISTRLATGKGTMGKLLSEDEKLFNDLAAAVSSIQGISKKIEDGEGTVGRLIHDDSLLEEIEAILEEVRATVDDFRETAPVVTFTSIFFGAL